jgi:hypothetical protein
MVLIPVILSTISLSASIRRHGIASQLASIYLFVIGAYTYLGTVLFSFAYDVPFAFFLPYSSVAISNACSYFFLLSTCLSFGFLFTRSVGRTHHTNLYSSRRNLSVTISLLPASFPLLSICFNYPIGDLFYRTYYYISPASSLLAILASLVLPFSAALLAISSNPFYKLIDLLTIASLFSLNSRAIVLYLSIQFLVRLVLGRLNGMSKISSVFILLFFFASTLFLRECSTQGLWGNILALVADSSDFLRYMNLGLNYMLSYPVAAFLASNDAILSKGQAFWEALSPVPSIIKDQVDLIGLDKINDFSPFTAISQLYEALRYPSLIAWAMLGLGIAFLRRPLRPAGLPVLLFDLYVMICFIYASSYNLRGFSRLIYLVPVLWLFARNIDRKYSRLCAPR